MTNVKLHPPGPGEGLRLIRTATVQVKCEYCEGKGIPDFGHEGMLRQNCPKCHGEGTREVEVRYDVSVTLSDYSNVRHPDSTEEFKTFDDVLLDLLQRFADGEDVEGVTKVRDAMHSL